ncbi:MAG: hypothetical protein DI622_08250 [Chryseobacterium sp.]|nr:MAG: hypothetical protein DI622_08250 [Chryseobacterium sp.]
MNHQKRKRNICFPTRSLLPFYLAIFEISFVNLLLIVFYNDLFLTDFYGKVTAKEKVRVRKFLESFWKVFSVRFTEIRNVVGIKLHNFRNNNR